MTISRVTRREFVAALGAAAAAWPLVADAQVSMPVVAFISGGDSTGNAAYLAAFRNGLNETGFVDGTNVTIEIHWLEGKFDRASMLTAELGRPPRGGDRFHDSGSACSESRDLNDPDRIRKQRRSG